MCMSGRYLAYSNTQDLSVRLGSTLCLSFIFALLDGSGDWQHRRTLSLLFKTYSAGDWPLYLLLTLVVFIAFLAATCNCKPVFPSLQCSLPDQLLLHYCMWLVCVSLENPLTQLGVLMVQRKSTQYFF